MKLGLGSYTFRWSIGHNGLNPRTPMRAIELLDVAKQHGLAVVQYADNIPLSELSHDELNELKAHAEKLNIAIELGIQSFSASQVLVYLAIAQRLGATLLRVALDGPDAKKPVRELADEFNALLPKAADVGVQLAIENHFNYPSDQLAELVEQIGDDRVGVCLDVANSICAGEWPMETVRKLAKHAINLHLKDYVIVPDAYGVGFSIHGCPLGQGRSDCQAILDALPSDKPMSVILEHWLPRAADMDQARADEHAWLGASVQYARQSLNL